MAAESPTWATAPTDLALGGEATHLWRVSFETHAPRLGDLAGTLSSDELARADRFHSQRDRDRFVLGRGALRAILARYLDATPQHLSFVYGPQGKPHMPDGGNLSFNLSHSGDYVLVLVGRARQVGVDVERVRPMPAAEAIAQRLFSPAERRVLRSPGSSVDAFFMCWTLKEAWVKAIGGGLSIPLAGVDVSRALTHGTATLDRPIEDPATARRSWTLRSLRPAPGYVAATCVEGADAAPLCFQL